MTEAEWLDCTDPTAMLEFLRDQDRASERKLRLFACACCRVWHLLTEECSRRAVEVGERYADGMVGDWDRHAAWEALQVLKEAAVAEHDFERARWLLWTQSPVYEEITRGVQYTPGRNEGGRKCGLLRDLFGNPFRPVALDPAWRTPDVLSLARAAYDEGTLPAGTLEPARLALLADALEDAGCSNADVLNHCRGLGRCPACLGEGKKKDTIISGPRRARQPVSAEEVPCLTCAGRGYRPLSAGHVRGCWVLDLLLGKE